MYSKEGDNVKLTAVLMWRIHDTDFSNNTIELTEIGKSIDGTDIADPKRAKYLAEFDGQLLKLQLSDTAGHTEITLKLNRLNGFLLVSDPTQGKQVDSDRLFSIGKINNDTSAYLKSSKPVKVVIEPIIGLPDTDVD